MTDLTPIAVPYSLTRLRPLLPPPPARLLEVGCGRGALAAELDRLGWQVTGVEPDADEAELARRRGVRVLGMPLAEVDGGDYDAVLFTRSLHHVADVEATLADAVRLLRPGGTVLLEEFARERVDAAAAAYVYDAIALLDAAGMTGPHDGPDHRHDEIEDDPLLRWRRDRGEDAEEPLHTGTAMLAALARLGTPGDVQQTEALWRMPAVRLTGAQDGAAAADAARALRRIECRRIADGTLPAIGFIAAVRQSV